MNTAHPQNNTNPQQDRVIARFQAQDLLFIKPLRELFESFGTRIIINEQVREIPTYEICAGDRKFVEQFLALNKSDSRKILCIIYGDHLDVLKITSDNVKYYYLESHLLTSADTQSICSFFFTSVSNICDTRKKNIRDTPLISHSVQAIREQHSRYDSNDVDQTRIRSTIQELFSVPRTNTHVKSWKFIFMLPILYALLFFTSIFSLAASVSLTQSGHISMSKVFYVVSYSSIQAVDVLFSIVETINTTSTEVRFITDHRRFLTILKYVQSVQKQSYDVYDRLQILTQNIFQDSVSSSSETSYLAEAFILRAQLDAISTTLGQVKAELSVFERTKPFFYSIPFIRAKSQDAIAQIDELNKSLTSAHHFLTLYPFAGGFRKTQTYLIVLQNSMELRPTGGFIGSLLRVTMDDGKITEIVPHDVYDVDGQLKGHVDPPAAIRYILNNEHWYLRDSNWDPDFSKSGQQAMWFYQKETGKQLDGVIAISSPAIIHLLSAIGSISLPDFNEQISAHNFYPKILFYAQENFFPGSTQKRDFLGSLVRALILNIAHDSSTPAAQIFSSIRRALDGRDVQVFFADTLLQSYAQAWNWAGSFRTMHCPSDASGNACLLDDRLVVAANLGVNKVNLHVSQTAASEIQFYDEGNMTEKLTISLKNSSPNAATEGDGDYRSYIRVYYPLNTTIDEIWIGTKNLSIHRAEPDVSMKDYAQVTTLQNQIEVGFFVHVKSNEQNQIMIQSSRNQHIRAPFTYIMRLRKQAGVEQLPWSLKLSYPPSWSQNVQLNLANSPQLLYNTDLTADTEFRADFK